MFNDKKILITGGTGTFGKAFTERILGENIKKLYIFSRDELKQWEMQKQYIDDKRVCFLLGDIRDKNRLYRAFEGIDYVIHAAAQKHVPSCEYNPFEAVKTNIIGAENIINAAIDRGVKKVLAISTDKAVEPVNLYGCTKACMEKLFIHGNNYSGNNDTAFSIVRYGNVIGSRGSVIPLWQKELKEKGHVSLTDLRMTRFWITIQNAVDFVLQSLQLMIKEEIFVPKLKSMKMIDLAHIFSTDDKIKIVGSRPGEKFHETLISVNEIANTIKIKEENNYLYREFFIIMPTIEKKNKNLLTYGKSEGLFVNYYDSGKNDQWMSFDEMGFSI